MNRGLLILYQHTLGFYVKQMHSYKSACCKHGIALFSTLVPIHRVHKRSSQAFKSLNVGTSRDRVREEICSHCSVCARGRIREKKEIEMCLLHFANTQTHTLSLALSFVYFLSLSPLCIHSIHSSFLSIFSLPFSPWH